MIDFLIVATRSTNKGVIEIYPKFIIKKSSDLMIRGGDFYAIWVEERGLWSTEEQDALQLIDNELDNYYEKNYKNFDGSVHILHMWDAESRMIDRWHKYCQRDMRDSFHMLDEKLIFSNMPTNKNDFASKKLSYPLEEGSLNAYNRLMSVLYSEEERRKIEWAIGAVVSGDSKKIQKFLVLYGAAGTGKSTMLNIIQKLFNGYYSVFDAKSLGSSTNSFALEAFKSNPLVAIQHDGDLSKIEDNTRLNSLVSHEIMTVNEKFKSTYSNRFKCFLFMGTNKPVKITDGKSGLIRRLIDVSPTGEKLDVDEYRTLIKQIDFELGAIAYHCNQVYLENVNLYDNYIPITMLGASNDFYNFVLDSYEIFKERDSTSLKAAWEMYRTYCDDAKVQYPFSQRIFKEELKNYFNDYKDRYTLDNGSRIRSYYIGFRFDKFESDVLNPESMAPKILLTSNISIFDDICKDCPAQYATESEKPMYKWDNVKTTLSDLDTSKTHYVKLPQNHIVIDFDIKDEYGHKSLDENLKEASKWPETYAEISKSGKGIHLHYIYDGDVSKLQKNYDTYIEIKVFNGNSSLRRKLTKCNNIPIATINSGLPLKEVKNIVNFETINSENKLRKRIQKNLNKEIHSATKPSIDFIYKSLEDAYNSGMVYDVSDMKKDVILFAANSTNQADYCVKLVNKMHFKSEAESNSNTENEADIIFFDTEVFPNLFLLNWKIKGENKPVVRMINPKPTEIEELLKYRLVGFNCRRYDNHLVYACYIGYSNKQLFELSQKIISGDKNSFFREAYNLSYTDIYDFASAGNKKSLKKLEIEMGIHHQELGLPWDQPVPEDQWVKVAEYCDNDVIATEAAFGYLSADWTARQILADVAGLSVNDTTNTLTTRIIFGNNRTPQDKFNYRDMGDESKIDHHSYNFLKDNVFITLPETLSDEYTAFDKEGRPIFPGYKYEAGVSTYRGEEVGEGGYVYAEPGMYFNVALLDVASMHPSSIIAENLFGEYTKRFQEIRDARIAIKHKDFDKAKKMLDGKLEKYLTDPEAASNLANALKTAINSVYGLTSANFDNPFRDIRNKDNIVAKRGALFMINLKHEVQKRGFTVAHIKTDSIKIPNATPEIIEFVMEYGEMYGYTFEHEATYERMCLVNDAVYIAKIKDGKKAGQWSPTGAQFAVPYVFKSIFSKEPIVFDDLCETKSVASAIYLDLNESLPEGEHDYKFVGKVGRFCPIKKGCGGGLLLREKINKKTNEKSYDAVVGTKGYRWLESESVKILGKENDIDKSYYQKLVDEAIETISEYGDYEMFISDDAIEEPPWQKPDEPFNTDDLPWYSDEELDAMKKR